MKIAMIGGRGFLSLYGGVETSIDETARRLAERGHTVCVYGRSSYRRKQSQGLCPNIKPIYIPTLNSKHLGTFIHVFLSTLHAIFTDCEVVHFHALGPSIFSVLARLSGKKSIVTIHGLDWKRRKWKYPARLFLKVCEYPAIIFPHKTIAVSMAVKEHLEKKTDRELIFIPNGVSIEDANVHGVSRGMQGAYILYVGRLVPEKGVHYLIRAFNDLERDMKLIIAGDAGSEVKYAKFLHSLAGPKVEFFGFVSGEQLRDLYRNAYIFVLPSEIEGLSLSLLEAMACGKGVLVSDIQESLEVIDNCGFSFKSGDPADLKTKLEYLIDNPEIVVDAGIKALERVRNNYNWDDIVIRIEEVYLDKR